MCRFDFLQECTSFVCANGVVWNVQGHITCNSKNVLYYLKCIACNFQTTYTGKTKQKWKIRNNQHRFDCRSGNTTDLFDLHVHECIKKNNVTKEPFFQAYAFLTVKDEEMLLTYESYLHRLGLDTMNV